jgi:hypothetical protein
VGQDDYERFKRIFFQVTENQRGYVRHLIPDE